MTAGGGATEIELASGQVGVGLGGDAPRARAVQPQQVHQGAGDHPAVLAENSGVKPKKVISNLVLPQGEQETQSYSKPEVIVTSVKPLMESCNKKHHECREPSCSFSTTSRSSFKDHMIMHERKDVLKDVKKTCPIC